mgnify:CR=1 FL=1
MSGPCTHSEPATSLSQCRSNSLVPTHMMALITPMAASLSKVTASVRISRSDHDLMSSQRSSGKPSSLAVRRVRHSSSSRPSTMTLALVPVATIEMASTISVAPVPGAARAAFGGRGFRAPCRGGSAGHHRRRWQHRCGGAGRPVAAHRAAGGAGGTHAGEIPHPMKHGVTDLLIQPGIVGSGLQEQGINGLKGRLVAHADLG